MVPECGNPKIIIYIPPRIFKPLALTNTSKSNTPVETNMTDEEIRIRTIEYSSKNIQITEDPIEVLDIYVAVIY